MRSATVSAPSLLIAMMPGTAAGTAGGRDETRTIALAETIGGRGTGTIALAETIGGRGTGIIARAATAGYKLGWIEDIRGFTTGTTAGSTPVK
jgi:hypothetical protein